MASDIPRLIDVFPPGFDSRFPSILSTSRGPYSFFPEQLFRTLTYDYNPSKHIEVTFVKSIWYGKQKKGARHEFILVEVQDKVTEFINYIVLDRNNSQNSPAGKGDNREGMIPGSQSSSRSIAQDTFRVSYNGKEKQLLRECLLFPREYLEKLVFNPQQPLYLYQLVTLAHVISDQSPNYSVTGTNCYWFAGLIWECARSLRPLAALDDPFTSKRGSIGMLRYTPEQRDIDEICTLFEKEMQVVEERLSKSRQRWKLIQTIERGLPDARSPPAMSIPS